MVKKEKLIRDIEEIINYLKEASDLMGNIYTSGNADVEHPLYDVQSYLKKLKISKEDRKKLREKIKEFKSKIFEKFWKFFELEERTNKIIEELEDLKEKIKNEI